MRSAARLPGCHVIVLHDSAMREDRGKRPQWRGERRLVMVRVPVQVAQELEQMANKQGASLSDVAGRLITLGLAAEQSTPRDLG